MANQVWYIGPKHQTQSKPDPDGRITEHVRQGDRGWNYYLTEREAIETVIKWLTEDEQHIRERRQLMVERLNDLRLDDEAICADIDAVLTALAEGSVNHE